MKKRSNKHSNKGKKTRKQKTIIMIGCSKKNKNSCKNKFFSTLGNKSCPKCGPNCHCGPNCKCNHPCPGNCYLNRRSKTQKGGGSGCGACGCPYSPLPWNEMNKFVGPSVNSGKIITQKGGTCGACGQIPVPSGQTGGELPQFNFFKPAPAIPGPFLGSSWGSAVKEWPGIDGISGNRNFLKSSASTITDDPQQKMSMSDSGYKSIVGGYKYSPKKHRRSKRRRCSSSKRGGGLISQDLVNLGRQINYNLNSAYNTLGGYEVPVNPLPYKDQLTGALNKGSFIL
jgi:hypothetical protein